MKDLVNIKSEELTSRLMAEMTGKRHADVVRDIKDEIKRLQLPENKVERIFALVEYVDKKGERRPMYKLTEKGWLQMAARYDAKTRYTLIDYIEKKKNAIPDFSNPAEAARAWANEYEKRKALEPKAEAFEVISNSNRLSTITEVAGLFDMGRNTFMKWLRANGYVMRNINKPYQKHIDAGLFDWKIDRINGKLFYVVLITGKGILHLERILNPDNQ